MTGTLLVIALSVAGAATAPAQTARELFEQGRQAYLDLELQQAARLLRQALALAGRDAASHQVRLDALTYLGAAHLLRGRRGDASDAFRDAVLLEPAHRPDSLRFPPSVLQLFDDVRQTTKAVRVRPPAEAAFPAGQPGFAVDVESSSFHEIAARITTADDAVVRELYAGPIRDGLTLRWDARDDRGETVPGGAYRLEVVSTAGTTELRRVRVPLDITVAAPDTVAHPDPPTTLLPERARLGPALLYAAPAFLVAAATVVLPTVVADGDGSRGRFVVGLALTGAGVATVVHRGPARILPDNVAANEAIRIAWRAELGRVVALNARRGAVPRIVIRTGAAERIEGRD